jgi:3-oxoacyl-[acyl-carrier protein] reductase
MELGLKDKVALITGASRGIGAASARALAYHGASVIINYIHSKDKAEKLLGEIKALYNCSQAVLADMVKRKSGKLIFISSSLFRFPGYGFSAHAAAKPAMDGMVKVMATELGPSGICVNVVGPGLTLTDATAGQPKEMHEQVAAITPLRRLGMPQDIAGAVLFLASSLSDYLSGEYIPVTGGSFMI